MKRFVRPSIGVIGQVVAVLLLALVIEFGVSTFFYERASQYAVREDEAHRLAEHLIISRRIISDMRPKARLEGARELSTDRYLLEWEGYMPVPPPGDPTLDAMRRQVIGWEPGLASSNLRLRLAATRRGQIVTGGLTLADGSWLRFHTRAPVARLNSWIGRIGLALLPALALMVLGGVLIRWMLLPLHRLAEAADRFDGGGETAVAARGPTEVRRVPEAFNRMQARIQRLIADRTQALAAVGHDLRTPLSRLRLRADTIAARDVREAVRHDVAEMEAMVASLLAFLGGDGDPEQPVRTDLAVLCATIVDAAVDAGHKIDYQGPSHCEIETRPFAVRRAVNNLVDNAVRYGDTVTVCLEVAADRLIVAIEDDGPGIPEVSLTQVLEPFVRLDDARTRDVVGFGLGLSIVARTVDQLGGTIRLVNRAQGGLRAEICLPIPRETLSHDHAAPQQKRLPIS